MELHVAVNYYNPLGYCGATCSFHIVFKQTGFDFFYRSAPAVPQELFI
jgi:hypothetical protein